MKTSAPSLLLALLCGASSSLAQVSPGVSAKPAGRAINEALPARGGPPANFSRPDVYQEALSPSTGESAYFEAAMRGEAWAQTKLGKSYVSSKDDTFRIQQGVQLLRQAAEQDNAEALFLLGSLSMAGHGMPQSSSAAFDYCRRAAELDFAEAQYELAAMYALGRGTEVDNDKALHWGRKAVDQGNTKAKYSVGRLLLLRENEADRQEALELLRGAIDGGIDEAGMFLAEAQAAGQYGLPPDRSAALAILQKLSARGNKEAAALIPQVSSLAQ